MEGLGFDSQYSTLVDFMAEQRPQPDVGAARPTLSTDPVVVVKPLECCVP
jgi:hypothetical protein